MGKLSNKVALVTERNLRDRPCRRAALFKKEGATVVSHRSNRMKRCQRGGPELGELFDVFQADVSSIPDLDRLYAHVADRYGNWMFYLQTRELD